MGEVWAKNADFGKKFKIPRWNYNSITIIQQHLIIYAHQLADL